MSDINVAYFLAGGLIVSVIDVLFILVMHIAYVNPRWWYGKKAYLRHMREMKHMRDEIVKEHLNEFDDEN